MNKRLFQLAGIVVLAASMVGAASAFLQEDAEGVPRYGEECAHGHNGFDCKKPQYKIDISELQEITTELDRRVAHLENSR